jgi:predicted lactoylglutathione lyase
MKSSKKRSGQRKNPGHLKENIHSMQFLSLEPFVPSGPDFKKSRELFLALGFKINWEEEGYAGFERDGCKFILQEFNRKDFAENFMISVKVSSAAEFLNMVKVENLSGRFNVRFTDIQEMPYGKEVNMTDCAGVCWHFVEE